ncbi:hypothetical protein [Streptomyces sp. A1136]|nr:hypothetical protein [Streptomyces sp. A1136]
MLYNEGRGHLREQHETGWCLTFLLAVLKETAETEHRLVTTDQLLGVSRS